MLLIPDSRLLAKPASLIIVDLGNRLSSVSFLSRAGDEGVALNENMWPAHAYAVQRRMSDRDTALLPMASAVDTSKVHMTISQVSANHLRLIEDLPRDLTEPRNTLALDVSGLLFPGEFVKGFRRRAQWCASVDLESLTMASGFGEISAMWDTAHVMYTMDQDSWHSWTVWSAWDGDFKHSKRRTRRSCVGRWVLGEKEG